MLPVDADAELRDVVETGRRKATPVGGAVESDSVNQVCSRLDAEGEGRLLSCEGEILERVGNVTADDPSFLGLFELVAVRVVVQRVSEV